MMSLKEQKADSKAMLSIKHMCTFKSVCLKNLITTSQYNRTTEILVV